MKKLLSRNAILMFPVTGRIYYLRYYWCSLCVLTYTLTPKMVFGENEAESSAAQLPWGDVLLLSVSSKICFRSWGKKSPILPLLVAWFVQGDCWWGGFCCFLFYYHFSLKHSESVVCIFFYSIFIIFYK